jgi:hypothetical protein
MHSLHTVRHCCALCQRPKQVLLGGNAQPHIWLSGGAVLNVNTFATTGVALPTKITADGQRPLAVMMSDHVASCLPVCLRCAQQCGL